MTPDGEWRLVAWTAPGGITMPLCEERVWIVVDPVTAPEGTRLGEMVREQRDVPVFLPTGSGP